LGKEHLSGGTPFYFFLNNTLTGSGALLGAPWIDKVAEILRDL
jgi:hypothetical protein